jgi:hypothetical protein
MKCQTKILRIGFIGIILSLLTGQSPFVLDSTLTSSLIQSISNSIEVGDINNDGFNDIIYSGYDENRSGLFIDIVLINEEGTLSQGYQTNFITYPDTIAEYLGGIGNISLSDVDLADPFA